MTKRFLAVASLVLASGCSTMSNTDKGVLTGGGLGAVAGGIVGHATGNTAAGAAIGGVLGGVAGGVTGNAIDKAEARADRAEVQAAAATAAAAQGPLGITDVASMAQQHISDDVIVNQIRSSGTAFRLSPSDINFLKSSGVSDRVVMEMQASANRAPRRVYTNTPVYAQPVYQPVYLVEPAPPPIGFGFSYSRHGRRY